MTNVFTPFQMGVEMQRQSIKATEALFEDSLDMQAKLAESVLRSGLDAQRSVQDQGTAVAYEAASTQFEVFQSLLDDMEREFQSALNAQFQRNATVIQQLLNNQFEMGADFVQQLLNAQFEGIQSAMDESFDGQSIIDSQFGALANSQDRFWEEYEPSVVDVVDQVAQQQQALLAQSTDAVLDAQQDFERQARNGAESFENVT